MYEPNQGVIWPSVAPISLELWTGNLFYGKNENNDFFNLQCFCFSELYLRWVIDQTQTKNMFHQIQALITKEKEMRTKVNTNFIMNHCL